MSDNHKVTALARPCAGCEKVARHPDPHDGYCILHPPADLHVTPEAKARVVDLHGKMMAKAEDFWRRAEEADKKSDCEESEQWEACTMAVEECAKMVAATSVAQRRPAPRGVLQMLLALHINDPIVLARAVDEMVQFIETDREADRRGEP